MRMRRRKATRRRHQKFLAKLSAGFSVTGAAEFAGLNRATFYKLRAQSPEFAERWDEAVEQGSDALEDELLRRAVRGTLRPVFYRGKKCGSIREFSDQLLIVALRARRPQKYRQDFRFDLFEIDKQIVRELERISGKIEDQDLASQKIQ